VCSSDLFPSHDRGGAGKADTSTIPKRTTKHRVVDSFSAMIPAVGMWSEFVMSTLVT